MPTDNNENEVNTTNIKSISINNVSHPISASKLLDADGNEKTYEDIIALLQTTLDNIAASLVNGSW